MIRRMMNIAVMLILAVSFGHSALQAAASSTPTRLTGDARAGRIAQIRAATEAKYAGKPAPRLAQPGVRRQAKPAKGGPVGRGASAPEHRGELTPDQVEQYLLDRGVPAETARGWVDAPKLEPFPMDDEGGDSSEPEVDLGGGM